MSQVICGLSSNGQRAAEGSFSLPAVLAGRPRRHGVGASGDAWIAAFERRAPASAWRVDAFGSWIAGSVRSPRAVEQHGSHYGLVRCSTCTKTLCFKAQPSAGSILPGRVN